MQVTPLPSLYPQASGAIWLFPARMGGRELSTVREILLLEYSLVLTDWLKNKK